MTEATTAPRPQPSRTTYLRWWVFYQALRLATAAVFFIAAALFAEWIGLEFTLPIAACAAAAICGFVAIKVSQAAGHVSPFYRLAIIFLPIGLRNIRGGLPRVFAFSTGLWFTIAIAGAIDGSTQAHAMAHSSPHTPLLRDLLVTSLFIDAAAFVLFSLQAVRQTTPQFSGIRILAKPLATSLVLIVGSVALWTAGFAWLALLLAGGPPAIVGVFYGVFVFVRIMSPP